MDVSCFFFSNALKLKANMKNLENQLFLHQQYIKNNL